MKFTTAVSALVLLFPVLVQGAALRRDDSGSSLAARQRGGQQGGRGQQQAAAKAAAAKAAAEKAAAEKAAAAKAAAAKAAANKGGKKGGNQQGGNNGATSTTTSSSAAASATVAADNGNGNNGGGNNGGGNNQGQGGNNGGGDPQTSLTLDPAVVQPGLAQDGQAIPEAGQVPSLTSTNNFINFCLTTKLALTDGKQVKEGSCNPTPMGVIIAQNKMPSAKFTSPKNGDTIKANTAFDIKLATSNMALGNFVNPATNYFAAPAQINGQGLIVAHSHVVVQAIPSVDSTAIPDPTVFAFFKGLNDAGQNGVLTTTVSSATTQGLPAGVYRMCSINTNSNHAPVLVAVAQHGSLDDCVYFTAA